MLKGAGGNTSFPSGLLNKGPQELPMWSKGVLYYDSGICWFKMVKTAAKILIIIAFKPEIHQNTNP